MKKKLKKSADCLVVLQSQPSNNNVRYWNRKGEAKIHFENALFKEGSLHFVLVILAVDRHSNRGKINDFNCTSWKSIYNNEGVLPSRTNAIVLYKTYEPLS